MGTRIGHGGGKRAECQRDRRTQPGPVGNKDPGIECLARRADKARRDHAVTFDEDEMATVRRRAAMARGEGAEAVSQAVNRFPQRMCPDAIVAPAQSPRSSQIRGCLPAGVRRGGSAW